MEKVMRLEEEVEKLKGENSHLAEVGGRASQSCSELQEQLHQIELDLTISQEKHRTCQKEVRFDRKRWVRFVRKRWVMRFDRKRWVRFDRKRWMSFDRKRWVVRFDKGG